MATEVPSGWRRCTFGDVFEESDERCGTRIDLPVLSVTKTRGPMLASERFSRQLFSRNLSPYRVARRHSIVLDPMLLWDGSIGLQDVVDEGLVSPDYRVYRCLGPVDPRFIGYLVREPGAKRHYQTGARGTNVRRNRIARSDFRRIPLLLPPLPEQRKITSIISSLDEAIEKGRAVLDQSQVVFFAIRERLLAEGMPNRHSSFRETMGGRVPSSWFETTLGAQLAEPIRNGYSPVCPPDPTGRWTLSLAAVTPEGFNPSGIKPAPEGDDRVGAAMLRIGDVVISRSNTRERVGLAGVYRGDPPSCSYPDLLMRIRPSSTLSPDFLEMLLLSERGRSHFMRCARGTSDSMLKIDRGIVAAFPIDLPSLEEQKGITEVLAGVQARLRAERDHIDGLRDLKLAMMRALLSGDLRAGPDGVAA